MPSFPTSAKTFTSKTSGQVIDPSHVNDLQDEVNAMEAGYLDGTARLNSSNSTIVNLSVTSGSTFTNRPTMPPPQLAYVGLDSTVTIGSSGQSTVAWNRDFTVTNSSMHSTGTNPARLIPQTTGVYRVACQLQFNSTFSGQVYRTVIVDSSGSVLAETQAPGSSRYTTLMAMGYKRFDVVGGHVVCIAETTGPSTLSLGASDASWATLEKL